MMYYGAPQPPQRSAIPRVVGILAIIFACMGIFWSAVFVMGPLDDMEQIGLDDEATSLVTWMKVWLGISGLVFVLHLIGGIMAVTYKKVGLTLLNVYAIVAILLAAADVALMFALLPSSGEAWLLNRYFKEEVVYPRIVYEVLAIIWPIITLALVNTRKAKEACNPPSAQQAAAAFS
jgi:hypothetical protein